MNDEERRKLAERLRYAPFMKGELMTRQGAEAHWLYILTKGSAEVIVSTDAGVRKTVAILHAGDFFGEMSLLTGEPRSASLKALEDSECYRLDRKAFEDILHGRPEIAHYLSAIAGAPEGGNRSRPPRPGCRGPRRHDEGSAAKHF